MLRIRDSNRTELIDVMQRDLSRLPIIKILILLPERGLATAGTCLFRRHRSQGLGTYFALACMSYEEQSCNDLPSKICQENECQAPLCGKTMRLSRTVFCMHNADMANSTCPSACEEADVLLHRGASRQDCKLCA